MAHLHAYGPHPSWASHCACACGFAIPRSLLPAAIAAGASAIAPPADQLADDVLAIIAPARAHARQGNLDGEESLSHVLVELRMRGWTIPGGRCELEPTLVAAGFSLREQRLGRGARRVFVGC